MSAHNYAKEVAKSIESICYFLDKTSLLSYNKQLIEQKLVDLAMMTVKIKYAEAQKELQQYEKKSSEVVPSSEESLLTKSKLKGDCLWKPKYLPKGETYDEYYQYSGTISYPKDKDFPSWYENALFLVANCSGSNNFIICLDKEESTSHRRVITNLEFKAVNIKDTEWYVVKPGLNKVSHLYLIVTYSDREKEGFPIDFAAWVANGTYIGEEETLENVVIAYTHECHLCLDSLKNSLASAFYDNEEDKWLVTDEQLSKLLKVPHIS